MTYHAATIPAGITPDAAELLRRRLVMPAIRVTGDASEFLTTVIRNNCMGDGLRNDFGESGQCVGVREDAATGWKGRWDALNGENLLDIAARLTRNVGITVAIEDCPGGFGFVIGYDAESDK